MIDSPKLTNWKAEPSIQDLKKDAESAKALQAGRIADVDRWEALRKQGSAQKATPVKGRSNVQPKLIRRQAEWRYSALSEPFNSARNMFSITPVTWEDTKAAIQNQTLLNWQFRTKIDRINFIDEYIHTLVDEGATIVQLGWSRQTEQVEEMAPIYSYYAVENEEQMNMLTQATELQVSDPSQFAKLDPALQESVHYSASQKQPLIAEKTGEQAVMVEKVVDNRPTLSIVNCRNFSLDPSCGSDYTKAKFAIVSFETCKADLEAQTGRYTNLDKVNWAANTTASDAEHVSKAPGEFNFSDAARKLVVAREYWGFRDIHGDGKLVPFVATWIGDVLIRMEESPFPDKKLPFVVAKYTPVKRMPFGEPDAEILEDNQKILGATIRGIIDLMGKSANGQRGMAKGVLDPLNKRRFSEGQDYEFNGGSIPVNQMAIEHKYPEIPASAFSMINLMTQEAESLSGVKGFSGGLSGESYGDVAAGIRGVLDASSKREMSILRRAAQGIKEIGQKIISMNQEFLSAPEVIRVTNEEFVEISREDIQGQFDLAVDISTPEIDDAKAKDLSFMLQTMGPKSDPMMAMMILSQIARLKNMPELAEKLENWKPPQDPFAEQRGQLEMERLQLENDKLRADAEYARARAAHALAMRDRADLDFVEQETGTNHAREMEKQNAQGQSNQALAVTKSLLASAKAGEQRPDIEAAVGFNEFSKQNDTGQVSSY